MRLIPMWDQWDEALEHMPDAVDVHVDHIPTGLADRLVRIGGGWGRKILLQGRSSGSALCIIDRGISHCQGDEGCPVTSIPRIASLLPGGR